MANQNKYYNRKTPPTTKLDFEIAPPKTADLIEKLLNKTDYADLGEVINVSSMINREIYIGDVDDSASDNIEAIIRFWNRVDEELNIPVEERIPIKIYIDSWGGEMVACYTIINAIELSKTPVWTINIGAAYSAGFFIFITGHKRLSYKLASFLYHEGANTVRGDAHKFRSHADFYKKQLEQLKVHVLKYTKLSEADYSQILKDDYWLTAEEALEKGIVDEIIDKGMIF